MDINSYLTPYKYKKAVIEPVKGEFSAEGADCPFLFRHNGKFHMMHIGFDGIGYQTALSTSDDLINWHEKGVILKRGCHRDWDKVGMAGAWILKNTDLYGDNELLKIDGKYWLFYHSYPNVGYENGAAKVGLAYTDDETLMNWNFLDEPIFTAQGGADWECGGLYKTSVIKHDDEYYMFYNAKNVTAGPWKEQTGLAISKDMIHWKRYDKNPILVVEPNTWAEKFVSDPCVMYDNINKKWVMFFFGYDGKNAREGIALSDDLYDFEKYKEPIIDVGKSGDIDCVHAHKPGIIFYDGVLYHFYCACSENKRCITFASSKQL